MQNEKRFLQGLFQPRQGLAHMHVKREVIFSKHYNRNDNNDSNYKQSA
jgi:hypothetical protein